MNTYKVGIVGFGWAAGAHFQSYIDLPNYEPVAILSRRDLDPAQIKSQYGVGVKLYRDYDKFLNDDEIQIVDICTENPLHPMQTVKAAEAKKNLIIEKPMALKYEDGLKMIEACQKNNVKTSVCFECRFISVARTMKTIIDQGLIGEVYYIECDYFHPVGPWYRQFDWVAKKDVAGTSFLHAGVHALDLMLWLTGCEAEEVFSYSTRNPNEVYKPYEYDGTRVAVVKFKNSPLVGKAASVIDCMQPYFFNLNVVGSLGTIKNDLFYTEKIEGLNGWSKMDVQLIDSGDVAHHPYREQFAFFAKCLDEGKNPHNNIESAFETHKVAFAIDKSAETGKTVSLSEFK